MFPFYGADGLNGTIAATEGSADVVGTGTNWQSNNAVPTAGGYGIKMPDGEFYGIDLCTGEGAITLSEDYRGGDVSGGSYYIIPLGAPIAQLLNQVSTLLGTSNYAQIAGLDPASGDFIQYLSGTWTTRTAIQTLTNLLGSASEVSVASASTADIGAVTSPRVQITGTTTITGFGTTPSALRFVRFAGALTLAHNATSLILPPGRDIQTAAGDTALFTSDASGNWRCINYQLCGGVILATGSSVSIAADGSGHPVTSVSLGAGRWRLSADLFYNGSDTGYYYGMISTTSGDISGDPVTGSNIFTIAAPGYGAGAITGLDASLSSPATYYLNSKVLTSTADVTGRLRAERII